MNKTEVKKNTSIMKQNEIVRANYDKIDWKVAEKFLESLPSEFKIMSVKAAAWHGSLFAILMSFENGKSATLTFEKGVWLESRLLVGPIQLVYIGGV